MTEKIKNFSVRCGIPGKTNRILCFCSLMLGMALIGALQQAHAQFGQGVQGTITDPSGAVVPNAKITITNVQTQVTQTIKSDGSGDYRFVNLVPGNYQVTVNAAGFAPSQVDIELQAEQTLNVPVTVKAASVSQTVTVTTQAPLLNIAETRNQLTLSTQALQSLPLTGRNMISLVLTAPGVTGSGVGGGSPGSAADNYSTETQVNASANGGGGVANMYIIDGLDATSVARPGVLNLTPNPDSIRETTIETNTYTVDYGRASSLQMVMSTKYGTDRFHGNASDYFTNQSFWSRTEFIKKYAPFHSNNISASLGGPIWSSKKFFFFGAVEPLLSLQSTGNSTTTVEAPEFTQFAQQTYPDTLGTMILTKYGSAGAITGVAKTAQQVFPTTCGTAASGNLPCDTPVIDNTVFNASDYRNGLQWNTRIDKYFKNDRIYGNFYRTTLNTGGPAIRPAFDITNTYSTNAFQGNETHTFSANTLNEAEFSVIQMRGAAPASGNFTVPVVNVTGLGTGFGAGFALGVFVQRNYHWRDVLTHVRGEHLMKFGYAGTHQNSFALFAPTFEQPTFAFNSLLDLAQDNPYTETSLAYDPITGKPSLGSANQYQVVTTGAFFAEDAWKIRPNLTLNYGLRWDDFGNPYAGHGTFLANWRYGPGITLNEQIANGIMTQRHNVLDRAMVNILSPRFGIAWSPGKSNRWVTHGGFGIYHNWPNLGNTVAGLRGNPPTYIVPTFFSNGTTSTTPIFAVGTQNTPPFGYPYPQLPVEQLDSKGGLAGLQLNVGGVQSNLLPSTVYQFSASLDHSLSRQVVVSVGYVGSRGTNLIEGSNQVTQTNYGTDINRFAGDLIQNDDHLTRLNQSFGVIKYSSNMAESSFDELLVSARGRFGRRAFFNAWYAHSRSRDDAGVYPNAFGLSQYMGPSPWDIPNAFSLSGSYELPGINSYGAVLRKLSSGWRISDITSLQAGSPFLISTNAPFQPIQDSNGNVIGVKPGSGDYNADGNNNDWPDINSYSIPHNRHAYLTGVFSPTQYSVPALGMEGNERNNGFRGPGFADSDVTLGKTTQLHENYNMEFRADFFNIFNRPNLNSMVGNIPSGNFGKATAQSAPRWVQFSANVKF